MTAQELGQALYTGNDIAMQWYLATHPESRYPGAGELVIQPTNGGLRAGVGPGALLLIGALILGAIYLSNK